MFPVITNDTLDSTLVSIQHSDQFTRDIISGMRENNPVLYSLLELIANSDKDPEYVKGFLSGATQFYTLAQRQIESDDLKQMFD